jgi:hypothetical protein
MHENVRYLLLPVAILTFQVSCAQSVYLDHGFQRTTQERAVHSVTLEPAGEDKWMGTVLNPSGVPMVCGFYTAWEETFIEHGQFTFFYPSGQAESSGHYDRGVRVGTWKRYNPDGSERPERYYPPDGAANLRKALGIEKS